MNRLTSSVIGGNAVSLTYANNGNINTKSDLGVYNYSQQHPNAVESVNVYDTSNHYTIQDISYTSFNMANQINQGDSSLVFTYGPDYARKKSVTNIEGTATTRYYSGGYEKIVSPSTTKELHYITANGRIVAIAQIISGTTTMYYVHTDHMGSVYCITNSTPSIVQETSYTAWGRRRNPSTWQVLSTPPSNLITSRGFIGQEHIDEFNLINLNARIYDPILCRFLSPDPYISNPGFTQDYNRYSYCVNNPLSYSDPSGYTWFSQFGNWLGTTGKKVVTTVVGIAVGVAVACIPGVNVVGAAFIGGMLAGATSGAVGAALNGGDVLQGAFVGGTIGAIAGVATLGIASAIHTGLHNTFSNRIISNTSGFNYRPTNTNVTYWGSLASKVPSIGSLISGVSNSALTAGSVGGSLGGFFPSGIQGAYNDPPNLLTSYEVEINRFYESNETTLSSFTAYAPNSDPVTGYFLEPGGPGSTVPGSGTRIPAGRYIMEWIATTPQSAWMGPNTYKITSPNLLGRGIRMHKGNTFKNTQGCLLPGTDFEYANGNAVVTDSGNKLSEILNLLGTKKVTLIVNDIP